MSSTKFSPEQTTEVRECDRHGGYEATVVATFAPDGAPPLRIHTRCPACSKEQEDHERAKQEAIEERERQRRAQRSLSQCALPARFFDARMDDFIADSKAEQRVLEIARRFVDGFDVKRGAGLLLLGKVGTGKTLLASAIVRAMCEAGHEARYVRVLDYLRAVKATYGKGSERSEREVVGEFAGLDLLVLDELGVAIGSEHEHLLLFDLLDRRYADRKATVVASNLTREELSAYCGERVMDRFAETGVVLAFDWASRRGRARSVVTSRQGEKRTGTDG